MAKEFYALPIEEKLKYDIDELSPHKINGYKPAGRKVGIEKGKRDGFEAYLVPRDGMCNPLPEGTDIMLPYALSSHRALLKRLMNDLHGIGVIVLRALSTILEVPENKTLENRSDQPSTSSLGVLKYSQLWAESPQLGHSAHTDVGSLTLLFCTEPGLRFFDPSTDEWAFVEPKEGHAIVNVGDSLRFLSGSRLKSCLHRVVPYPDARIRDRYSCAYFMRPELDPVFRDDSGKAWRSIDWHDRKYTVFRASISKQQEIEESAMLTEKAGYIGLWNEGEP